MNMDYESIDYERELTAAAATVEPLGQKISPAVIAIGTDALYGIDARYGPASDNPRVAHDGPHSLAVARRDIELTNLLYRFIRPEHRKNIYNFGMLVATTHDWEQLLGYGANERASVDYLIDRVAQSREPELNTPDAHSRLTAASLATTVEFRENGEIVQVNLRTGEPDPLTYITGFVDINGIAMEGWRRMLSDGSRHGREKFGPNMTLAQHYAFLATQQRFLRKRLNDYRIQEDIAYHFPDHADEVYQVMRQAFHANILSAHGMAVNLGKRPVSIAVKGIGAIDQVAFSNRLGKVVYRAMTTAS
jgi:hypothetical protein